MSKKILVLLVFAGFAGASINASAVEIRGAPSCKSWLHDNTDKFSSSPSNIHSKGWLAGYLSGLAVTTGKDYLKGLDNEFIFDWVSNYCSANPSQDLSQAGQVLAKRLIKQKKL